MRTARYESDGRERSAVHGVFRKGPGLCVRQGRKPARRGGSRQRRFPAYEKYPTFDADRASVSTWLYTITRNTVIDYFRTHRPGAELPDDLPDAAGIDDGLLQRESLQALGEALNRLDERLRALIVLRYGKGLSLKDTAARLGVSYAYVKILHSNALKTLRECFEAPIK